MRLIGHQLSNLYNDYAVSGSCIPSGAIWHLARDRRQSVFPVSALVVLARVAVIIILAIRVTPLHETVVICLPSVCVCVCVCMCVCVCPGGPRQRREDNGIGP